MLPSNLPETGRSVKETDGPVGPPSSYGVPRRERSCAPATLACSHAGLWSQHHEQVLASALHPVSGHSVDPYVGVGRPSFLSNEGKKKAEERRTSSSPIIGVSWRLLLLGCLHRSWRAQRWLPALVDVAVAFWVPIEAAAVMVNVTLPFWLVVTFFWPTNALPSLPERLAKNWMVKAALRSLIRR